jgi:3-dehydroquinate synthase
MNRSVFIFQKSSITDPSSHREIYEQIFCPIAKKFFLISNARIANLYASPIQSTLSSIGVHCETILIPDGEKHKNRQTKERLEDELLQKGAQRDSCLIALGGGVILDMVGFTASTYYRGIPCVYIPTSLLAMVDASIGGKTGINTPLGKNLIGTFSLPKAILLDIHNLKTLPEKEFFFGLAEMVKIAAVCDRDLLLKLYDRKEELFQKSSFLEEMIKKACEWKQKIVEKDSFDHSSRQILNFGHTFAHAIERGENFEVPHGLAVILGMYFESFLSYKKGFLSKEEFFLFMKILDNFFYQKEGFLSLLQKIACHLSHEKILQGLLYDKKRVDGNLQVVFLQKLGKTIPEYCSTVEKKLIEEAFLFLEEKFLKGNSRETIDI